MTHFFLSIFLILMLGHQTYAFGKNSETKKEESFIVSGVILATDKSPLPGHTVIVFPMNGNVATWLTNKKGHVINPMGGTDLLGKFKISVSRNLLKDSLEFKLKVRCLKSKETEYLLHKNKSPVTLNIDFIADDLDMGEIIAPCQTP